MNSRLSAARSNTQDTLNDYKKRMKEDIKSLKENFLRIVEAARYEERSQLSKTTASLYDTSQVQVRAAKIVLAGENLMKLIAELKTFLVIYDFPAINENLKKRSNALEEETKKIKSNLLTIREDLGDQLYPGEDEYYSTLRPLKAQGSAK
ncbi:unnamed protein product, partial [Oikopleura dioica]